MNSVQFRNLWKIDGEYSIILQDMNQLITVFGAVQRLGNDIVLMNVGNIILIVLIGILLLHTVWQDMNINVQIVKQQQSNLSIMDIFQVMIVMMS